MNLISFNKLSILLSISLTFMACGSGSLNSDRDPTHSYNTNANKETPNRITKNIPQGVHISEFMASNLNTLMDRDYYAFSDWIELYNNSDRTIDIGGYYLSDDKEKPTKWKIPQNTTIKANSYLLIWADKKDKKAKELHTNFKLSSKKDDLIFSNRDKKIIDSITFKDQEADISATPYKNSVLYMKPTPKKENSSTYTTNKRTTPPQFSQKSGSYDTPFDLSISANDGALIYYTTDGSIPTTNSKLYSGPIHIDRNMVINAISIRDGLFKSYMANSSYFIGMQSSIPVVSVSINPAYLYDDMIGIYVDGKNGKSITGCIQNDNSPHNFAQNWKRPAYISYFDQNKNEIFDIGADFAISGECSRFYKKKSFKAKLDHKYGQDSIDYQLYDDKHIGKIKDFKIRAGNRGYEIGDILGAKIVSTGELDIDYQSYKTVKMFLNGEYWGVYNLREKKGKDFLKENYPNLKKVDIIKNSKIVKEGSIDEYNKLDKAKTPQELLNLIDLDNFIDYMAFMIYSGNEDWSYSNSRAWRERKAGAKWRWMIDDVDEAFDSYYLNVDNLNGEDGVRSEYHEFNHIFTTLMSDPSIKNRFKDRFYQLLDTTFSPSNMRRVADEVFAQREPYMPNNEPTKWFYHDGYNEVMVDYPTYKNRVYEFAQKRANIVRSQLDSF